MAEQLAFEQVLRDRGAVHRYERAVRPARFLVDIPRNDLLPDAAFACDQDRGVRARHLVGQRDYHLHIGVAHDHRPVVVRDGSQHGGDQCCLRRQRNELLGSGPDGGGGALRVGGNATGHHRYANPFVLVGGDQPGDIQIIIDHQKVSALTRPQRMRGRLNSLDVAYLGTRAHRHFDGGGELPA